MSGRWLLVAALGLSIFLIMTVAWVDYLPTNDGPQHIFAAHALRHLDDASAGYGRYLERGGAVTDIGFELSVGLFGRLMPWRPAVRVTLCVFALVWAWGVMALAATLGHGRQWLGLLGFATALQWLFYMGLFSYYLSVGIGFFVLALAFAPSTWTVRTRLGLATLLLIEAVAHVVPAALLGLSVALYAFLRAPAGARLRALGGAVLLGTPAGLVALAVAAAVYGSDPVNTYTTFPTFVERTILIGRGFVSGPSWRAWPAVGFALLGLGAAVRLRRLGADPRERALLIVGGTCLVVAWLSPLHVVGWEFFSVRFSPLGVTLLALLAPVHWFVRLRATVAACLALFMFAAASVAWGWSHNLDLRHANQDLLAGLDAPVRRHGPRLPLIVEPPAGEAADEWGRAVPFVRTNWHLGALYSVQQGGVPAYLFAGFGGIQDLAYRAPPGGLPMPARPARGHEWQLWENDDPAVRVRALTHMLSFGPDYEDVIFHGRLADLALLRERGFVPDFQRGGLVIARFLGCPASIELRPPSGGLPPTLVTSGWLPAARPTFSVVLPADPDSGARLVPISNSPCGEIWIRVLYDMDRSGSQSTGDRHCAGANVDAVVTHRVMPGQSTTIVCEAGPRI